MKPILVAACLALSLGFAAGARADDDAEGCKDSPVITRLPGSTIHSCEHREYDLAEMTVGKDADGNLVIRKPEGDLQTWDYGTREGMSDLQVFRNFENALKKAGFTIDYEDQPGVITAHKGKTWFALDNKGSFYYQTILTEKAMEQEVTADANALAQEIRKSGHVAVYGIQFETNQATIRPDSEATLTQIAKLLADDPKLRLRIEGYTDNVGQAAANQALSGRRAEAVRAWLTAHGIAAARLASKGMGAANPVADNKTEEGRAKNRRVELVSM